MSIFDEYLSSITKAYNAGNATEHTHRPALKILIESLTTGIVATNEPRRVKCGAPDYIVTKGHTPLGYIEAKDIGKPLAEVERSEQLMRYLESLGVECQDIDNDFKCQDIANTQLIYRSL